MTETNKTIETLTNLKQALPDVFRLAEVVGAWVWVQFDAKPSADCIAKLKELGFHWNHARGCWQHPCGKKSSHSRGNPRWTYGSIEAEKVVSY